jgi:hypothetical protein
MDRWADGQMDGCVNGWMSKWVDTRLERAS